MAESFLRFIGVDFDVVGCCEFRNPTKLPPIYGTPSRPFLPTSVWHIRLPKNYIDAFTSSSQAIANLERDHGCHITLPNQFFQDDSSMDNVISIHHKLHESMEACVLALCMLIEWDDDVLIQLPLQRPMKDVMSHVQHIKPLLEVCHAPPREGVLLVGGHMREVRKLVYAYLSGPLARSVALREVSLPVKVIRGLQVNGDLASVEADTGAYVKVPPMRPANSLMLTVCGSTRAVEAACARLAGYNSVGPTVEKVCSNSGRPQSPESQLIALVCDSLEGVIAGDSIDAYRRAFLTLAASVQMDDRRVRVLQDEIYELGKEQVARNPHDAAVCFDWARDMLEALDKASGDARPPQPKKKSSSSTPSMELVKYINSTSQSLDICLSLPLDVTVVDSLVSLFKQGVPIRILIDEEGPDSKGCDVTHLVAAEIPIRVDTSDKDHIIHRFAVVDQSVLVTGSFSSTPSSIPRDLVVTDESRLVMTFQEQFDTMWADFEGNQISPLPDSFT